MMETSAVDFDLLLFSLFIRTEVSNRANAQEVKKAVPVSSNEASQPVTAQISIQCLVKFSHLEGGGVGLQ